MSEDDDRTPIVPHSPAEAGRLFAAISGADDDLDGFRTIGHWRLLRLVGEGADGEVFEVARPGAEARFALKLFRHGDPAARRFRRAQREIDMLVELQLDGMPRVIESDLWRDRLYVVTEFIDGSPIDRACNERNDGVRDRIRRLLSVVRIVQNLHEHGVIHRDIKPTNVLVDNRNRTWLIDLGVAGLLQSGPGAGITVTGVAIGTPGFMAPEQFNVSRDATSIRTDVYGLGALAWVLLTGATPHDFRSESLGAAVRRLEEMTPRDPRSMNLELDRGISAILSKAVMRRPVDRYESAAALADDLQRWLDGRRIHARPVSPWVKLTEWIGRHPVLGTSGIFIGLILTATFGVWSYWSYAGTQPGWITVDGNEGHAILFNLRGEVMRQWGSGVRASINAASIVRSKSGEFALIAFDVSEQSDNAGKLVLFDLSDEGRPVWRRGVLGKDILNLPAPVKDRGGFLTKQAMVADIFQGGDPEIAALHYHEREYHGLIRVYDLEGNVLWEAWHPGRLYEMHWLAATGQLVCSGVLTQCSWSMRGLDGGPIQHDPLILVAMTPQPMTHPAQEFIETPGHVGVKPDWHVALLPGDVSWRMKPLRFSSDFVGSRTERSFRIEATRSEDGAQISWQLESTPDGPILRQGPLLSDGYLNALDGKPDPERFYFAPLPPCEPQ